MKYLSARLESLAQRFETKPGVEFNNRPLVRRRDGTKYIIMWNREWMEMKPVEEIVKQALEQKK